MTSMLLRQLQRDPNFRKQEQPPPPAAIDITQLNEAIAKLIQQAAQAGAAEAVKQQPKPRTIQEEFKSPPLSSEFPPAPPKAAPQTMRDLTVSLQRDGAGVARYAQVGKVLFEIQRNSEGRAVRLVQVDEAPVLPPPPIPCKAAARKYKPGEPR